MSQPYEIVGAPLTLYLAPAGTEFPALDDAEADFDPAWFKVGTSGDKNYTEEGVTVSHPQSLNYFRGAGSQLPRKAFRTEEDLLVSVQLADLSPDQYAKVINDNAVETVAAGAQTMGYKRVPLGRGTVVREFALLARGVSSIDESLPAQYQVPTVIEDGSPAPVFTKGNAAVLAMQFRTIDAAGNAQAGDLLIGSAPALGD